MNWVLIGLGGFVLYEVFLKFAGSAAAGSSTTSTSSNTAANPPASTLRQQIQAMAGNINSASMDVWNFYYNQILAARGQAAVSPDVFERMLASAGLDDSKRSTAVTLDQYMNTLTAAGLSGFGIYAPVRGYGR
jgi:hypothetical protein